MQISFEYRRGDRDGMKDICERRMEAKEGVNETPAVKARQEIVAAK